EFLTQHRNGTNIHSIVPVQYFWREFYKRDFKIVTGVVNENGRRAQFILNRSEKLLGGIGNRQINLHVSKPHATLGQFGGNQSRIVLRHSVRFLVVLVPVGKENIAAEFGDFSAYRRADPNASANASHQRYSALQWFRVAHGCFRKPRQSTLFTPVSSGLMKRPAF